MIVHYPKIRANMQVRFHIKRLLSPGSVCIGFVALAHCPSHAGTADTDLSKDLNRSAFSTTAILSDLANINKQVRVTEANPVSGSSTLVSSQPGAFRYNPENRQATSVHKLTEEIRATQQLEKARNAEISEHPFWYARFWTRSPLAIPALLLGGDHHALETPPSQFEKLSATSYMDTNYNSQAELKKFERSVGFGNSSPAGDK
jgi:hypothetical protein